MKVQQKCNVTSIRIVLRVVVENRTVHCLLVTGRHYSESVAARTQQIHLHIALFVMFNRQTLAGVMNSLGMALLDRFIKLSNLC